jgi:hypothetical protein
MAVYSAEKGIFFYEITKNDTLYKQVKKHLSCRIVIKIAGLGSSAAEISIDRISLSLYNKGE